MHKLLLKLVQGKRVGTAIGDDAGCEVRGALPLSVVFAEEVARAVVAAVYLGKVARRLTNRELASRQVLQSSGENCDNDSTSAPFTFAATPVHICTNERLTWVHLVQAFAAVLRDRGLEVPAVRFSAKKDTGFVSVDCGALEGGKAVQLFPNWAPGLLRPQLEGCVDWWLGTMQTRHETSLQRSESDGATSAILNDEQLKRARR